MGEREERMEGKLGFCSPLEIEIAGVCCAKRHLYTLSIRVYRAYFTTEITITIIAVPCSEFWDPIACLKPDWMTKENAS